MITGNLKSSYASDEQVFDNRNKRLFLAACVLGLVALGLFANDYVADNGGWTGTVSLDQNSAAMDQGSNSSGSGTNIADQQWICLSLMSLQSG